MNRIIIIDGGGAQFRAIFAHRNNPAIPATFTYLNMVSGYLNKLEATLNDTVIIAQDYGNWRKDIDKNYKAQRQAAREEKEDKQWWLDKYEEFNQLYKKLDMALPFHFIKKYKCFAAHTRISLPNKKTKMIKDLKVGEKIYSFNEKTKKIEISKIKKIFKNKVNERYHIKFGQFNSELITTGNHPFYTKRGWICAKNLKLDDIIYTIDDYYLTHYNKNWFPIGYIHGYLKGDGWINNKQYLMQFTSKDKEGLTRIKNYIYQLFRCRIAVKKDKRGYYNLYLRGKRIFDSLNKNIMKINNLDYRKGFLAGFYDAEGCLTQRNDITISNCDKNNILFVEKILKQLKIYYKKYLFKAYKINTKPIYRIDINYYNEVIKFFQLIPNVLYRKRIKTIRNGLTIQTINKLTSRRELDVFNLEVTPNNTYFANSCLVHNCEADDIASVACRYYKDKEIILISSDKDWEMLLTFTNVKIYSPISKKFKDIKNPMKVLLDKIQGDISDNLLEKPSSEAVFKKRKKIVDLINPLPDFVEKPIKEELDKIMPKNLYLHKIPFNSIRLKFEKIYKLNKDIDEPDANVFCNE